jgi:hypothetical protein
VAPIIILAIVNSGSSNAHFCTTSAHNVIYKQPIGMHKNPNGSSIMYLSMHEAELDIPGPLPLAAPLVHIVQPTKQKMIQELVDD